MDTEEPGKPRKSYRGWWIAAGVVVLAVTIVAFLWLNGQHRLQRKIEALHAKGFPITFEEIEAKRRLPDGTPNAADLYQQAFDAYQESSSQGKPKLRKTTPDCNEPLSEGLTAEITQLLNDNQQTLNLLKKAAKIKSCSFDLSYSTSQIPIPDLPSLNSLVKCDRLLYNKGLFLIERDDIQGFLDIVEERFSLGAAINRQPFLIEFLIQASFCNETIYQIERVFDLCPIQADLLDGLDNHLKQAPTASFLAEAYRNELPELQVFLKDVSEMSMISYSTPLVWTKLVAIPNISECINRLDEIVSLCESNPVDQFQYIKNLEQETENRSVLYSLTKMYLPSLIGAMETHIRCETRIKSVRTAIAVERYRLDTGKLPERLEELVPKYMEKVPIDPYDGKPLRYKRLEKGYTIYSIGEDGKDDGGKKKKSGEESFDYPFTVHR